MKTKLMITMLLISGLSALSALAKETEKMLHVSFTAEEGQMVNLSFPVSLLRSFEPQIENVLQEIKVNEQEINFMEIWQAVKDAGPTEFVEVNSADADIKVSTTITHLLVNVHEKKEGHKIDVTIPLALGDALFTTGEFDYEQAIQALLDVEGDLVTITSDKPEGPNGRILIE
jgi:hypothetical protein